MSGIRQIVPVPDGGETFPCLQREAPGRPDHPGRPSREAERLAVRAVGTVLPFRTNAYVIDELIDWTMAPDDPVYRLVFPQANMLPAGDVARIAGLLARGAPDEEITAAAHDVRMRLNPHPAGQLALNIPDLDDEPLPGVQHKYPETVLVASQAGPDLPRVLHVLLPVGPVRG